MAQFASIARPAEGTLIAGWDEDPHGTLQLTGAEAPLAKEEQDPAGSRLPKWLWLHCHWPDL